MEYNLISQKIYIYLQSHRYKKFFRISIIKRRKRRENETKLEL